MRLISSFYIDKHGWRRALAHPQFELVGMFLMQDVQGSEWSCNYVLEIIDSMIAKELPTWEGTGNAHYLTLNHETATIECIWSDTLPACSVPLSDFREAVVGWLDFIRTLP